MVVLLLISVVCSSRATDLVHDATQDLIVHLRGVDRVVCPRAVRVIRCVWLLRPEDREVRLFRREDVIHEDVGQIREPTPGESPGAVERIRGLAIVEPLNRNRSRWVAIVTREYQCSRAVGVDGVLRKGVPSVLEVRRETQRDRRILVKDSPLVGILNERGAALPTPLSSALSASPLGALRHTASACPDTSPDRFHHPEVP